MSLAERIFLWLVVLVAIAGGAFFLYRLQEENNDLRIALSRLHEDQDELNANFRQLSEATEKHLTSLNGTVQGISKRVGSFTATKDPDTGAVVWE